MSASLQLGQLGLRTSDLPRGTSQGHKWVLDPAVWLCAPTQTHTHTHTQAATPGTSWAPRGQISASPGRAEQTSKHSKRPKTPASALWTLTSSFKNSSSHRCTETHLNASLLSLQSPGSTPCHPVFLIKVKAGLGGSPAPFPPQRSALCPRIAQPVSVQSLQATG